MLLSIAEKTDTFAQFITVLVIFAFVLFLTAAVTKWIAGYQKTQNKNRNIEVIETSDCSCWRKVSGDCCVQGYGYYACRSV